ncbi:metallophosphoesterase family protein [Lachnoclostridium phytofermentans]|uniref:Metallophosphoesterase n=1 Tax=Lachnoclostridium phytofermentans (strain ATCC 700394 / DSM 18823 / ISDg) TaxID=357809 RepID=A9KT29_LACP7|nr:metallophosphoesterase family protein [Lachnoclostridium phytofermentans]ABX42240.1 metallophosphoesterase [Lachnoclostridium phytofermentans ISDg]
MTYFTADLHLGYKKILKFRKHFNDVQSMDSSIISLWNEKVRDKDEVYILGDLTHQSIDVNTTINYIEKLNGKKHLIIGNHDAHLITNPKFRHYFKSIDWMEMLKFNNNMLTLCHFPLVEWTDSHRNVGEGKSLHLYGHTHDSKTEGVYEFLKENYPYALNVGVDINHFEPVTLEECKRNNATFFKI